VPRSWKAQFQVVNDGKWYDNAIRLATELEATLYATSKLISWTAAVDSRVTETDDAPTHVWTNSAGLVALPQEVSHDAG
jgi:hypothetical protein